MDSALDSGAADLDVDAEGVEFDLDVDVEGAELRQMVEQSGKQTHGR